MLSTVLPSETPATEPVSVADAVAEWRLPVVDTAATDEATKAEVRLIQRKLQAARELVESYTGRYFAGGQRVELVYELAEPFTLPVGAEIESVSGFFTSVEALNAFNWEEYRKGISINRQIDWYAAGKQTYTVIVSLPESAADNAPGRVKEAILELGGEFYRNRETSSTAGIGQGRELPVSYRVKLADLVLKPALF
jgi:hypothetical protein